MSLFLIGGSETFPKVFANLARRLFEHPSQRAAVAADPSLAPDAMIEALRFDMPTQFLGRTVVRDVELHGEKLRAGEVVLFLYASANRDPREFSDPDAFDIARRPPRILIVRPRHPRLPRHPHRQGRGPDRARGAVAPRSRVRNRPRRRRAAAHRVRAGLRAAAGAAARAGRPNQPSVSSPAAASPRAALGARAASLRAFASSGAGIFLSSSLTTALASGTSLAASHA